MKNMNVSQNNIISAMKGDIFQKGIIDPKIRSEVPFFRKILIDNYNNYEVFHGYINRINEVWFDIINRSFKVLINIFNNEYEIYITRKINIEKEMIKVANEMATKDIIDDLEDLGITSNISSLIKGTKKIGISKKGPSKKKLKK